MAKNTVGTRRRRILKKEYWGEERAWTGDDEKGWFRAPRTLPLLLALLASKAVSGSIDPTRVYLELLARHVDGGVVQMVTDEEHAFAAGYPGERGVRSWRERMRILESAGVIKIRSIGARHFAWVLLVHPSIFVPQLERQGKAEEPWLETYRHRQFETGEVAMAENDEPQSVV